MGTARSAGVAIVIRDTQLVQRGKVDDVFISITGIGPSDLDLFAEKARSGDRMILLGLIGDQGIAVMSKRQIRPNHAGVVMRRVAFCHQNCSHFQMQIIAKRKRPKTDEALKPLDRYRAQELEYMKLKFLWIRSELLCSR